MTICANCGQPTSDVYHVDGRTIGGCCWDPFGCLEAASGRHEPASENGVRCEPTTKDGPASAGNTRSSGPDH